MLEMGMKYDLYVYDVNKQVTLPYDDEMKKYIQIRFLQHNHLNGAVTVKEHAAEACPVNWYNGTIGSGDVRRRNNICPMDFGSITIENLVEDSNSSILMLEVHQCKDGKCKNFTEMKDYFKSIRIMTNLV